ncbi:hypothetical protein EV356DRAFT_10522 [Viridothelium virens]|uniref:Alpha-1,3-mannosyltransferase n=1 Tax=Viridothelium virens TaxID=1048519 RepID=A0A6A6HQM9_VIRVR|nr:hypothetical protein EV356DRAFT_10522 [Viridothelium virens]
MPPYLHPRSGLTTSLFTTTLAVSFLVVSIPHILPCPVNPKQLAESDADGFDAAAKRAKRRERRPLKHLEIGEKPGTHGPRAAGESGDGDQDGDTLSTVEMARRRECPVPKPGGLIGEIMGFRKKPENELPPTRMVKVEPVQPRKYTKENDDR